jgi:hypothetical protein
MSDSGKVMIGTDGNPLLSPDGKIVLADDLYPAFLAFVAEVDDDALGQTMWKRTKSYNGGSNPGNSYDFIKSTVWESPSSRAIDPATTLLLHAAVGLYPMQLTRYVTSSSFPDFRLEVTQRVVRFHLTSALGYENYAIPWSRVCGLSCAWQILAYENWTDAPDAVPFHLAAAFGDDAETPTAGESNEPWDGEDWEELGVASATTATANQVLASGVFEFPIPPENISTENPWTMMYALWEGGVTSPPVPSSYRQSAYVRIGPVRIVYNLAI